MRNEECKQNLLNANVNWNYFSILYLLYCAVKYFVYFRMCLYFVSDYVHVVAPFSSVVN